MTEKEKAKAYDEAIERAKEMITEDYCSFEVAKLLKEKGFNTPVWTRYEDDDDNEVIFGSKYNWNNSPMGQISAPTHQMAMAWLREKGLYIEICTDYAYNFSGIVFRYTVYDNNLECMREGDNYSSYEEAVEAALKYCLENLI